jgi:hypothetical protein
MDALRRAPAVLASLLLAAHFLRWGSIAATTVCLLVPLAFVLRSPTAVLLSRLFLLGGTLVWIVNAVGFARERMADGRPYARMLLILLAVAAFTAWAAWLLPGGRRARVEGGGVAPESRDT